MVVQFYHNSDQVSSYLQDVKCFNFITIVIRYTRHPRTTSRRLVRRLFAKARRGAFAEVEDSLGFCKPVPINGKFISDSGFDNLKLYWQAKKHGLGCPGKTTTAKYVFCKYHVFVNLNTPLTVRMAEMTFETELCLPPP